MTLETFRMAPNLLTDRRQSLLQVMRRGLLRCTNQNCQVPEVNNNGDVDNKEHFCLWNCDLAAYLNMLHSDRLLCKNGQIPERFRCDFSSTIKKTSRVS